MKILRKTPFFLSLTLAMAASAAQPRASVNWWWFYDVENAPGANKSPAQTTGQTNRMGDVPFYWSPSSGACSYLSDPSEPGNLIWSVKDNTTTTAGRPIASNNSPPAGPPYNGAIAVRSDIAPGITLAFRLKSIDNNIPAGSDVDVIVFNNHLLNGPGGLNDRHRFKFRTDGNGNTYLYNSQIGMSGIGSGSPLISDDWHDVWYTSWVGGDGLYHKRAWVDGVLIYNDLVAYGGETSNERRWGFLSDVYTCEWFLDYFGIYDEGAIFLPPKVNIGTVDGSVVITWDYGVLQEASQLPASSRDWTDVSGATSPYTVVDPGLSPKKFYRVRSPAM